MAHMEGRHYRLIEKAIRDTKKDKPPMVVEAIDGLVEHLAVAFKRADGHNFSRAKWLRGCGWPPSRVLAYLRTVL